MLKENTQATYIGPIATDDNPMPRGGRFAWLDRPDSTQLRYAVWEPLAGKEVEGTILIVPGRTEVIEKYFEVIGELLDRGFGVVALDIRGQGLSTRPLADRLKGHVRTFQDYVDDLAALIDLEMKECPAPRLMIGHSLGGHIVIRYLGTHPTEMDGAILSAPMLSIRTRPIPGFVVQMISFFAGLFGKKKEYVPGGEKQDPLREQFSENIVTHDERRFQRQLNLLHSHPELALGAPTFGWLGEAFKSMRLLLSTQFLRNIERRLLIVAAGDDKLVGLKAQKKFVEGLPQGFGRVAVVDNAFHEILMETDAKRSIFWDQFERFVTSLKVSLEQ